MAAPLDKSKFSQLIAQAKAKIAQQQQRPPAATGAAPIAAPQHHVPSVPVPGGFAAGQASSAASVAALQAKVKAQLAALRQSSGVGNLPKGPATGLGLPTSSGAPAPKRRAFMKLDASGRVIDESGKVVQLEQRQSDFAGNARAKRQEKLSQVTKEVQDEEADRTNSEFYDARLVEAAKEDRGQRKRRALRFHEPGKFQEYADRLRAKAKLEQLQSEVSSAAQKAGISAAARLALVPKREELESTTVPDVEWWDQVLLGDQTYEAQAESGKPLNDITRLVQHPVTFDQYSAQRNVTLPAYLTKKEQKKIRKQRRRAEEEEKQTLIGLGKMEAPAPKVKISNLMRVLGTEAVQDPTKVEAVVRAQMQMRQRQHEEHNAKTKLSDEQRRAKKAKKLQDSTADGVAASLFLVSSMKSEKNKFKVETNAKQYNMTGAAIMTPTNNIVIVEGGPRNMRKYKRLMTHRINWNDKVANSAADDEDGEGEERGPNTCTLIWEGTLERRFFKDFFIKFFRSEALAREWLDNRRSAHYWDLALTSDLAQSEKQ